jgi:hypothetical protein
MKITDVVDVGEAETPISRCYYLSFLIASFAFISVILTPTIVLSVASLIARYATTMRVIVSV